MLKSNTRCGLRASSAPVLMLECLAHLRWVGVLGKLKILKESLLPFKRVQSIGE